MNRKVRTNYDVKFTVAQVFRFQNLRCSRALDSLERLQGSKNPTLIYQALLLE